LTDNPQLPSLVAVFFNKVLAIYRLRYFNTLKNEIIYSRNYKNEKELYDAIDNFAYVTYNHERPHTYDNGRTPFEARYNAA